MPPRPRVQDRQMSFVGGLNITSYPQSLGESQARLLTNARLTDIGAAIRRNGAWLVQETPVGASFAFAQSNGFHWGFNNTILAVFPNADPSIPELHTTTYPNPFTAGIFTSQGVCPQYRFTAFRDGTGAPAVYLSGDPSAPLEKWDGTALTTLSSAIGGDGAVGAVTYNNRLWAWNAGGSNTNSLYYSALNDGDSVGDGPNGGGQVRVDTFGDSAIVACAVIGGSLLVFHEQGISRLTGFGQDDIQVAPQAVTRDVGMGNGTPSNLVTVDAMAYFLTARGLYMATEGAIAPVGTPDKPDPVAKLLMDRATSLDLCRVGYSRQTNEVWVYVPGYGTFVYHLVLRAWAGPWNGPFASQVTNFFEVLDARGSAPVGTPEGNPRVWFFRDDAGLHYLWEADRPFQFRDGGTGGTYHNPLDPIGSQGAGYTVVVQPRRFFCGDPSRSKLYREIAINSERRAGNIVTELELDLLTDAGIPLIREDSLMTVAWENLTDAQSQALGTNVPNQTVDYVTASGTGPWVDVTITDTDTDQVAIAGVTIEAFDAGYR